MATKAKLARSSYVVAGCGLLAGALLHVVVLIGGPDWIAFVGAPPSVVDSSRGGTWLAPVSTLGIAFLLTVWALYAFSAAGLMRRLPFARTMLSIVAVVFIVRGLIIAPALAAGRVNWHALIDLFIVSSSLFILAIGVLLAIGLVMRAADQDSASTGARVG
jgi:hypothetical protein